MKPLQQLFGLALEQIYELQRKTSAMKTVKKDILKLQQDTGDDLELFMKRREKYTSAKIKTLLFEKFLTKISHKQNNMQSITSFFTK